MVPGDRKLDGSGQWEVGNGNLSGGPCFSPDARDFNVCVLLPKFPPVRAVPLPLPRVVSVLCRYDQWSVVVRRRVSSTCRWRGALTTLTDDEMASPALSTVGAARRGSGLQSRAGQARQGKSQARYGYGRDTGASLHRRARHDDVP